MAAVQAQRLASGSCLFTYSKRSTRSRATFSRRLVYCSAQADIVGSKYQFNGEVGRRRLLTALGVLTSVAAWDLLPGTGNSNAEEGIHIVSETEGFGQHAVQKGDWVLMHYVGVVDESGQVFDSTKGGLKYRDGGLGVFRPVALQQSGYPQPGICEGLQQALLGMKVGGRRRVSVPASLGFGDTAVLAPYAAVPAGSRLTYDIELVRVSAKGPDSLWKGISQCGAGGASATADNCANIQPGEFF